MQEEGRPSRALLPLAACGDVHIGHAEGDWFGGDLEERDRVRIGHPLEIDADRLLGGGGGGCGAEEKGEEGRPAEESAAGR